MRLNYESFMGLLLSFSIISILKIGVKKASNSYIFVFVIIVKYMLIASLEPTIRQFLAISIIVLSYKYIEEKKMIKYLLCILIAMQFHSSAIIGVIIYFWIK